MSKLCADAGPENNIILRGTFLRYFQTVLILNLGRGVKLVTWDLDSSARASHALSDALLYKRNCKGE